MMSRATLRLVLLVSCAHALVHVYELSFGNVEQLICQEFNVGKDVAGNLGACLRLPYGLCALLAGWLADRFGAKRLLLVYLLGCSAAALLSGFAPSLAALFAAMFTLGLFASIYHPAGVGLITHHTNPENRPLALGYHGIFGSIGIAAGPLLAGLVLATGATWRQYYLVLIIPGLLLAVLLWLRLSHEQGNPGTAGSPMPTDHNTDHGTDHGTDYGEDNANWKSYFILTIIVSLAGIVYAAILTFLPRYLDVSGLNLGNIPRESLRVWLTSAVLLLGILGQFTAGWIAKPRTLEPLMALAFFAAAPCVLWMGLATGAARIWAAGLFAPLFFMHQPLLNSLVAKYVPRRRRSLCYGLSFTCGFGIGGYGPRFAGYAHSDLFQFATLAGLLVAAAILSLLLWRWNRPGVQRPTEPLDEQDALL